MLTANLRSLCFTAATGAMVVGLAACGGGGGDSVSSGDGSSAGVPGGQIVMPDTSPVAGEAPAAGTESGQEAEGGAAAGSTLSEPKFEFVNTRNSVTDVRVSWQYAGAAREFAYKGGINEGTDWAVEGATAAQEVVLSNVPANGQYWFCVTPASTGDAASVCGSFATPLATGSTLASGPAVNECANARPEWIWCDDFEKDRLNSYFEASMPRRDGVGREGSHAVVGRYTTSNSEAGNLKLAFGRTPHSRYRPVDAGTRNFREVFWRVYVKLPSNWQGGGADKLSRATVIAGSDWQQAMIAHVWAGTDKTSNMNRLKIDPASGTSTSGSLRTTRYNDFNNLRWLGAVHSNNDVFGAEQNGKWKCVEARVKLNDAGSTNGIFELWVDGQLEARKSGLNWVGSYSNYGINSVFLENYWNNRSPVSQERYMDNFVVSTQRIGCGDR